jgi:peroxiredoxin
VSEGKPVKERLLEAWSAIEATDMSLADKLLAYERASRHIVPETLAAYDRMVERTVAGETLRSAPQVGDTLPDFLCPDNEGHLVSLSKLVAGGPVVVSLNRGHWCPYCKLELRELAKSAEAVAACGARLVSIVPELEQFSQQMASAHGLLFPILTDLDLSYALSLGLVTPPGLELKQLYERAGINLPRFQGNEFWLLPSPATFVVDQNGRIAARFIDPDFRRRMPIDEILAALRALKQT